MALPRPALPLLGAALLLLTPPLSANTNLGYTTANPSSTSAVVVEVPADFLAAEIRLRSDEDDWQSRVASIDAARRALASAAAKAGFSLDSTRLLLFKETYKGGGSGSSFSFFSYSYETNMVPGSVLRLLAPLDSKPETAATIRAMKTLIDGLKLAKKTSVTLGDIRLALNNPEARRSQLLAAITRHIEQTRSALGATSGAITRLDSPLMLTQLDEHTIGLFLPFEVVYTTAEKSR